MNSRERVLKAIEFNGPDKVPILHAIDPAYALKYPDLVKNIMKHYPEDFARVWDPFTQLREDPWQKKGVHKDPWGVVWRIVADGLGGQAIGYPLENLEALEKYEPPDPLDDPWFDRYENYIQVSGHEKFIIADMINLFERAQWLREFKNLLVDIVMGRRELDIILDTILNYNIERIKRWCEIDIDGISFFDDWGTQEGLMINPKVWKKIFKPRYKKMFDLIHKHNKYVHFHSDGYMIDIIPDLMEIGVNTLNVQLTMMGIKKMGELFGGKICFISQVDRQHILPYGTPEDVKRHVKEIFDSLGRFNGGLIGCGEISPDAPPRNAIAMYEAFREYGQ
ncbi:MAG: uroporphyrinogen decarboxylase family protein, partial [bacterium]